MTTTQAQEALAVRFGFDTFAELTDEIDNHDPRGGIDYFEAMTPLELEIYMSE